MTEFFRKIIQARESQIKPLFMKSALYRYATWMSNFLLWIIEFAHTDLSESSLIRPDLRIFETPHSPQLTNQITVSFASKIEWESRKETPRLSNQNFVPILFKFWTHVSIAKSLKCLTEAIYGSKLTTFRELFKLNQRNMLIVGVRMSQTRFSPSSQSMHRRLILIVRDSR